MVAWFMALGTMLKVAVLGGTAVIVVTAVVVPVSLITNSQSTATTTSNSSYLVADSAMPSISPTPTPTQTSDAPSPAPQPVVIAPQPPTGFVVSSAQANWAVLSWVAPKDAGSSPLTGYLVMKSADGVNWKSVGSVGATTYSYRLEGLPAESSAQFAVEAISAAGYSYISNSATVTTGRYVPTAPTSLGFVGGGGAGGVGADGHYCFSESAGLSFTAPSDVGASAIDHYEIMWSADNGAHWYTTTDLAYGGTPHGYSLSVCDTQYALIQGHGTTNVRIRAVNSFGAGASSTDATR